MLVTSDLDLVLCLARQPSVSVNGLSLLVLPGKLYTKERSGTELADDEVGQDGSIWIVRLACWSSPFVAGLREHGIKAPPPAILTTRAVARLLSGDVDVRRDDA